MSDAYTREMPPEGYWRVHQAEDLDFGLPVYVNMESYDMLQDFGPYMTINALKLAIEKKMATDAFDSNEMTFKFWTPQPLGSARRKNRRVAMKATLYRTEEERGWILLSPVRTSAPSDRSASAD